MSNAVRLSWLIAQLEALNLARRGLWQLGAQIDPARVFPGAGVLLDVRLQILEQGSIGVVAGLQDDERARLEEPVGVLFANYGRLEHCGVGDEHTLDLERRDPDARYLEHVVGTAAVVVIAALADAVLIAGVGPFAAERAPRLLALQPVVLCRRRALDDELADLALRHGSAVIVEQVRLVAGHRSAGRAVSHPSRAVGDKDVQHLGRADAVNDLATDFCLPAVADLLGQCLASRGAQAQPARTPANT